MRGAVWMEWGGIEDAVNSGGLGWCRCAPSEGEEPSTGFITRLADTFADARKVEHRTYRECDAADDVHQLYDHFLKVVADRARLGHVDAGNQQDCEAAKDKKPAGNVPALTIEARKKQNRTYGEPDRR